MKPESIPSTLRERAASLASLWPEERARRLGFDGTEDVLAFLELELGCLNALETPQPTRRGLRQAVPPQSIYHVCASNLDVSSETSLFLGLLLGSRLWFKLPQSGLPGFEHLVRNLPDPWASRVFLLNRHDPALLQQADAVVLFGSDATVEEIRRQARPAQRVLVYGHKLSGGLVLPDCVHPDWAERAASEIAAYRQSGCLSPQLYLCADANEARMFAQHLAAALAKAWPAENPDFAAASAILAARDLALLKGSRLLTGSKGAGWTVELASDPHFAPGPGHGFIQVAAVSNPWDWFSRQTSLSALSITQDPLDPAWLDKAVETGARLSRICSTGRLQEPPLDWPHDGRPRLADLLRWISVESPQA